MENDEIRDLRLYLEESYNIARLKGLSIDLGFDWENLAGDTKIEKIISLIDYSKRQRKLEKMKRFVRENQTKTISDNTLPSNLEARRKEEMNAAISKWALQKYDKFVHGVSLKSNKFFYSLNTGNEIFQSFNFVCAKNISNVNNKRMSLGQTRKLVGDVGFILIYIDVFSPTYLERLLTFLRSVPNPNNMGVGHIEIVIFGPLAQTTKRITGNDLNSELPDNCELTFGNLLTNIQEYLFVPIY